LLVLALFAAKIAMPAPQQNARALNDIDIINMTKSGLAESTILAVIQASPTNFDVTPEALVAMRNAGVTQSVISTVVAAATNKSRSSTPELAGAAASSMPAPARVPASQAWPGTAAATSTTREPSVVMLPISASSGSIDPVSLPLEKTQLSQTKGKAS